MTVQEVGRWGEVMSAYALFDFIYIIHGKQDLLEKIKVFFFFR